MWYPCGKHVIPMCWSKAIKLSYIVTYFAFIWKRLSRLSSLFPTASHTIPEGGICSEMPLYIERSLLIVCNLQLFLKPKCMCFTISVFITCEDFWVVLSSISFNWMPVFPYLHSNFRATNCSLKLLSWVEKNADRGLPWCIVGKKGKQSIDNSIVQVAKSWNWQ